MTPSDSSSPPRSPAALWLPPLLVMALIFILSSSTMPSVRIPLPHPDKIAHFIVYGVLGFLLGRAAAWSWGWSWQRSALFAILVASAYGASDEWHQSYVKGRSVEAADWAADTLGAALALIPAYFRYGRKNRR